MFVKLVFLKKTYSLRMHRTCKRTCLNLYNGSKWRRQDFSEALLSVGCGLKVKNRNKYRKRDEFEFLNGWSSAQNKDIITTLCEAKDYGMMPWTSKIHENGFRNIGDLVPCFSFHVGIFMILPLMFLLSGSSVLELSYTTFLLLFVW